VSSTPVNAETRARINAERRTGLVHRPVVDVEKLVRVARDDSEVTTRDLARRFSISASRVNALLREHGVKR
jgi:ribosome-binding protein aMBF1 (putative translation factor)